MGRIAQVLAGSAPSAQARMAQIAPLRIAMRAQDNVRTPLLVAGDLNSPPRGLFFGAISRGLDDAWQCGGRGIGSTFPAQFPLLPIDHVLARNLTIARAFVPDVRASDHRPLVVDFRFQGGRSQLKLERAHALNL